MPFWRSAGQDVRQAFRVLRGAPAFAATAILTLVLGIGANTAVFSVVNALLFRPLPVSGADRLAVLASSKAPSRTLSPLSYPDIEDYRAATAGLLEGVAGYSVGFAGVAPPSQAPARVLVTWVTGDYFPLLGGAPAAGRLIGRDDVRPGHVSPVVVLGYTSWRTRFNADPEVIGRALLVNGRPCTVVGVAPRGFTGTFAFSDAELYLPLNWSGAGVFADRGARSLHTLTRLRRGIGVKQVNARLEVVAQRLELEHPDTNTGLRVVAVRERLARPEEENARTNPLGATIILLLVALVFVGAEINVMNLLVARVAARRKELAIRAALGASRARLVQQVAIETMVLAVIGGAAGILAASWLTTMLGATRLPGSLPVRFDFHLDARVLAYALLLTCVTAATVGVLAALRAARVNAGTALRDAGSYASLRSRRPGLRTVLVVGQTAVCFVLLVAAAMFTRSLREARDMDLGFDPRGVLNVQMDAAQAGYTDDHAAALFDEIERRVRGIAAVEDVAYAATVPLGYVILRSQVNAEGAVRASDRVGTGVNAISARYFDVMRIPIVRGRSFDDRDTAEAPRVAIVNAQLARALWPGSDPIGRRFQESADGPRLEVVGVAGNSKYHLLFEEPQPFLYLPLTQRSSTLRVLHIRTPARPESLSAEVERAVRATGPALPLYDVQSMEDALDSGRGFFLVRRAAVFSLVLGALAALLAMIGLYGVVSCAVAERSRELGIRLALGATAADIARMVIGDSALLAAAGSFAGAAGALFVGRIIARFLFGIAPTDPVSFLAAALCLALVTLIAAAAPAARAMRTDPVASLRQ